MLPLGQDIPGQGFDEPRMHAVAELVAELATVVDGMPVVDKPPVAEGTLVGEPNEGSVNVTAKLEYPTPLSP